MKISHYTLVMLIAGSVDGIRNLPLIAIFGQQLIFFFAVASLLFLLPVALISAELCLQLKGESGIYVWVKKAFGSDWGVMAIWLQWINTMVWFPTCLTALVGTGAWLIDPRLVHHPVFLVGVSLLVFWSMTLFNVFGIKQSARIAAWASTIGMLIPIGLIILLSIAWMVCGKPQALVIHPANMLASFKQLDSWSALTGIVTTFLGIELAMVHVRKVESAPRVFPRALLHAVLVTVLTMGIGSLAVALVIPAKELTLVAGTIQVFNRLFAGFYLLGLDKVLGVMMVVGSLGAMVNWLISPANGLAGAARDGYLPKIFAIENQHGVPYNVFLLQGIVVSIISFAFFLLPSVNSAYWLLTDLSTEIYMLMYVLMFAAAIKIILKLPTIYFIPGGKMGVFCVCGLGLLGCVITLIVGFLPPNAIYANGLMHYILMFSGGLLILIAPCVLLKWYRFSLTRKNVLEFSTV